MNDIYGGGGTTVTTSQSWGSRIKGALSGLIIGPLIVAGACFLLFKNEGRAVKRYQTLKEGAGNVITASPAQLDPALDGKLVHFAGDVTVNDQLREREAGIVVDNAMHLARTVEMYQWVESSSSE